PAPADPPTVVLPGSFSVEATGPSGAVVTYSVTVTDDYPNPGLACSPSSGATFPLGVTTVDCAATDSTAGPVPQTTTGSFDVTVVDTTPPTLNLPGSFAVEATGPGGATVVYSATATDLVDGSIAPSCSASSGSTFPLGTTAVNC